MSRRNIIIVVVALGIFGAGTGFGFLLNNYLLAGDGEASEEISAPTLDPNGPTRTPSVNERATQVSELETQVAELEAALATGAALDVTPEAPEATEEGTVEAPVASEEVAAPEATEEQGASQEVAAPTLDAGDAQSAGRVVFRIASADSEVRFRMQEELMGAPNEVVGVTDQVAGDILVDFDDPAGSQVGTIRINVRTLTTDNDFRNQSIRARILESARPEYEFSQFVPTEILGLPETVAVGDTFSFQITGDLTVKETTRSVTFETTVTVVSDDRLEGTATATVVYADFGLVVPDTPGVANVGDETILEIDFVALRVDE